MREEAAKRLERRRKKMLSPEERLARLFSSLVLNFWHFNHIKPSNLISTLAVIILFGRITGQPVGEVVTADEVILYKIYKGYFIIGLKLAGWNSRGGKQVTMCSSTCQRRSTP